MCVRVFLKKQKTVCLPYPYSIVNGSKEQLTNLDSIANDSLTFVKNVLKFKVIDFVDAERHKKH